MQLFNPAHPGELILDTIEGIREETGKNISITEIAAGIGITRKTLSALINCRQSVTPEMALRLEIAFPNTGAEFWLTVQKKYDLAQARKKFKAKGIKVFWKPNKSIKKSVA